MEKLKEIYEDVADYYFAGHSVDETLEHIEITYGDFFVSNPDLLEEYHDFLNEVFD